LATSASAITARELDEEFFVLASFLLYTGARLSEALRLRCDDVRLDESFGYVRRTKNVGTGRWKRRERRPNATTMS
jgi:integrase